MAELNKEALEAARLVLWDQSEVEIVPTRSNVEIARSQAAEIIAAYLSALPMPEPVAWRYRYTFGGKWRLTNERMPDDDNDVETCEPLYAADAPPPLPLT